MTSRQSTDQQSTDSQSENSRDNIDVASPNSNEETSLTEEKQFSGATRMRNNQKDLEKLSLQSCLKNEGGCEITPRSELRV